MVERLKPRDMLSGRGAASVAAMLSGLAIAGCGDRVSGSSEAIEQCGQKVYNFQFGKEPLASTSKVLATSQADVVELQKRALANGGSINLSDYRAVEVAASPHEITIGFTASNWSFTGVTGDYVTFKADGATATVSPGAVVCSGANGNLYPNGTYHALEKYTQETAAFPE